MIVNGFLSIVWGYVCQQTEPYVDRLVDVLSGWNLIVKYTIGIMFILPMFLWTLYKLVNQFCKWMTELQKRDILTIAGISYTITALGVGIGVVFGHMTK